MVVGMAVLFAEREVHRLFLGRSKQQLYAPNTVEIRLGYWPGKNGSSSVDVQKMADGAFNEIMKSPFFSGKCVVECSWEDKDHLG